MEAASSGSLYPDAATCELLMRCSLVPEHRVDHPLRATHASRRRGEGIEFHQFRPYQQGDDLRRIDWRLYGRSDRLYVREAEQESRLTIGLLIDVSASMGPTDQDPAGRLHYAARLAACIAWLASQRQHEVCLMSVGGATPTWLEPGFGPVHLERIMRHLLEFEPGGQWQRAAVDRLAERLPARTHLYVFSDFFGEAGEHRDALADLLGQAHAVTLAQILTPGELEFNERGQIEVVDAETGATRRVAASRYRQTYLSNLQTMLDEQRDTFARFGARLARVSTDTPLADALQALLAPSLPAAARLLVDAVAAS